MAKGQEYSHKSQQTRVSDALTSTIIIFVLGLYDAHAAHARNCRVAHVVHQAPSFLVLYHLHTRHIASPPLSGCHCSRHKGALLRLRTCRPRARSRGLKAGSSRPRITADTGSLHYFQRISGSPLRGSSLIVIFPLVVDSRARDGGSAISGVKLLPRHSI